MYVYSKKRCIKVDLITMIVTYIEIVLEIKTLHLECLIIISKI